MKLTKAQQVLLERMTAARVVANRAAAGKECYYTPVRLADTGEVMFCSSGGQRGNVGPTIAVLERLGRISARTEGTGKFMYYFVKETV